jgi:hypothetical protein
MCLSTTSQCANKTLGRERWTAVLRVQALQLAVHLRPRFGNDHPMRRSGWFVGILLSGAT